VLANDPYRPLSGLWVTYPKTSRTIVSAQAVVFDPDRSKPCGSGSFKVIRV